MTLIETARQLWSLIGAQTDEESIEPHHVNEAAQAILDCVESVNGGYILLSTSIISVTTDIPIPAGTRIKDINIAVLSGNPTVNIPGLPQAADLVDDTFYPITANKLYPTSDNLKVEMSGDAGSIKVQIIIFNNL
jgi:hypothetical protein